MSATSDTHCFDEKTLGPSPRVRAAPIVGRHILLVTMRRARFRELATSFLHGVVQPESAEFRAEGRGAEPGDLMRETVETFERLDARPWASRAHNVAAAPVGRSF